MTRVSIGEPAEGSLTILAVVADLLCVMMVKHRALVT